MSLGVILLLRLVFCLDQRIWAQTDLPDIYLNPPEDGYLPIVTVTSVISVLPLLFLLIFLLCRCWCRAKNRATDDETKSEVNYNSSSPDMDSQEENQWTSKRNDVSVDILPEEDRQMDMHPHPRLPSWAMQLRTGGGTMVPSLSALFCLGLCLGQVIQAQKGPLPKPSLRAVPSTLVPLGKPVTISCQGPPGMDLYRLEEVTSRKYLDQAELSISAMERRFTGRYRCSYQKGSDWSPPSNQLELVATGVFIKPSLSAQPSTAVAPGADVTLRCQSQYGFDQFALYKEGDTGPYQTPERWYQADFPITTVTAAHSGTYRCYSFSSSSPYLWSAPSDPLELVVTETSVTPSWLPTEPPSSVTEFSEASRKLNHSLVNEDSTTEPSRNSTVFPKESDPPTGLALQYYTKGNLVRICLGAVILILLVGILAEDWHSRKKPLMHRVRAVHRPLPPLPQTQKSHSRQDGGRADGHNRGYHH
ncbi:platelet glycoprotein VI [Hippopotamus amphibius kiboko]|uniref:platelet glycoprotein VI n=1 Tax=Hippopotamus amphibius kiboko TaxID=575201 RepID=UPI0025954555|nr:platelet glycoprotein VI [Hippopotamus amphibius kiboko]